VIPGQGGIFLVRFFEREGSVSFLSSLKYNGKILKRKGWLKRTFGSVPIILRKRLDK